MNVAFHLYFPDEASAHKASESLKTEGYAVETRASADGVEWLAFVSMSLPDANFEAVQTRMTAFARAHGGRFDGYEEDA